MITVPTITATVYVGSSPAYTKQPMSASIIHQTLQNYVDRVGLCLTITDNTFVYTDGNEPGFTVGLINYPRFPSDREKIRKHALAIAQLLKDAYHQLRVTVVMDDQTYLLDDSDAPAKDDTELVVYVDGIWHRPEKINDQRAKQGWVGYRLNSGRVGVAVTGEYREIMQ